MFESPGLLRSQEKLRQAEKELQQLRSAVRAQVIAEIVATLNQHSLTVADVLSERMAARMRPRGFDEPKKPRSSRAGKRVPIKYRGPEAGQEWSGRGRTPAWITALEGRGHSRDQYLAPVTEVFGQPVDETGKRVA